MMHSLPESRASANKPLSFGSLRSVTTERTGTPSPLEGHDARTPACLQGHVLVELTPRQHIGEFFGGCFGHDRFVVLERSVHRPCGGRAGQQQTTDPYVRVDDNSPRFNRRVGRSAPPQTSLATPQRETRGHKSAGIMRRSSKSTAYSPKATGRRQLRGFAAEWSLVLVARYRLRQLAAA